MRLLRVGGVLILAVFGPGLASSAGAGFGLFRSFWGDVVVATDTTPEGEALTPPTPDRPVYFLGKSLGCRLGSIPGDDMPDAKEMTKFITGILAKQGYVGARPGVHEPTLYLVVQWGYIDPRSEDLLWFLGYNPAQDIGYNPNPSFLGPEVFRRGFRSHAIQTILENANGAIYGIIVTAFEYQSVDSDKPVIYWQSRIGLPANGKSMMQALPTMLRAAGPAIGRPSDAPVLRSADDVREGRVDLGELEFLPDEPPALRDPSGDPQR